MWCSILSAVYSVGKWVFDPLGYKKVGWGEDRGGRENAARQREKKAAPRSVSYTSFPSDQKVTGLPLPFKTVLSHKLQIFNLSHTKLHVTGSNFHKLTFVFILKRTFSKSPTAFFSGREPLAWVS